MDGIPQSLHKEMNNSERVWIAASMHKASIVCSVCVCGHFCQTSGRIWAALMKSRTNVPCFGKLLLKYWRPEAAAGVSTEVHVMHEAYKPWDPETQTNEQQRIIWCSVIAVQNKNNHWLPASKFWVGSLPFTAVGGGGGGRCRWGVGSCCSSLKPGRAGLVFLEWQ